MTKIPFLELEPEKYLYIGCIPVSVCKNQPSDQSRGKKISCPHCKRLMWLSENKRKMKNANPDGTKIYCLECLAIGCLWEGIEPELIDIGKIQ